MKMRGIIYLLGISSVDFRSGFESGIISEGLRIWEWYSKWISERISECISECISLCIEECISECISERISEWILECILECISECISKSISLWLSNRWFQNRFLNGYQSELRNGFEIGLSDVF